MGKQDKIFFECEGNNWFTRNKESLKPDGDLPIFLMEIYNIKPRCVLEVGASNGYRLAEIYKKFKAEVYAVDPSQNAIKDGEKEFPFIIFQRATMETMQYERHFFDLIIVNSVFHWIDRETLLSSIANLDSVLKWGGYLIIGDFQLPYPIKRKYHHLEEKVFTYKLDYKKIFLSTGFYKEIATISKDHDKKSLTGDTTLDTYFSVSLLKKEDIYIER